MQATPLGDQPGALLLFGGLLAFAAGALRMGPPLLLGSSAMLGFPVWALADLALNGGHSLLPFELAFYAVYALLGVGVAHLGVGLARLMARLLRHRPASARPKGEGRG